MTMTHHKSKTSKIPTMKSLNAKKDEGAAEENAALKKDAPAAEDKADKVDNVDKAPKEMSAAASDADEKAASASVPQTPSVPAGEKLDAGISYEDARQCRDCLR